MSTKFGQQVYEDASVPLTNKITCTAEMLIATLASVQTKAQAWNLMDCLEIPKDVDRDLYAGLIDLTRDYGQLLIEQVRKHCEKYVNRQCRGAQDLFDLYMCLFKSLTMAAKNKVLLQAHKYHVVTTPCSPLLLKVIMLEGF